MTLIKATIFLCIPKHVERGFFLNGLCVNPLIFTTQIFYTIIVSLLLCLQTHLHHRGGCQQRFQKTPKLWHESWVYISLNWLCFHFIVWFDLRQLLHAFCYWPLILIVVFLAFVLICHQSHLMHLDENPAADSRARCCRHPLMKKSCSHIWMYLWPKNICMQKSSYAC